MQDIKIKIFRGGAWNRFSPKSVKNPFFKEKRYKSHNYSNLGLD